MADISISTAADLYDALLNINNHTADNIQLTADIDMANLPLENAFTNNNGYFLSFDGGGYTVSNIKIKNGYSRNFFIKANTIKNVKINGLIDTREGTSTLESILYIANPVSAAILIDHVSIKNVEINRSNIANSVFYYVRNIGSSSNRTFFVIHSSFSGKIKCKTFYLTLSDAFRASYVDVFYFGEIHASNIMLNEYSQGYPCAFNNCFFIFSILPNTTINTSAYYDNDFSHHHNYLYITNLSEVANSTTINNIDFNKKNENFILVDSTEIINTLIDYNESLGANNKLDTTALILTQDFTFSFLRERGWAI